MSISQPHLTNSQNSTKASSAKSNVKSFQNPYPGKENINFLNFSKIAINSSSKSQEKRCNTDFPLSSFNISKFTTERVEPYKFQTEANSNYHIISSKNFPNSGHLRSQSIANMPYKMPIHEPAFKRPNQKGEKTIEIHPNIEKNQNAGSFQKSFQSQNLSISIQRKAGDLIEIPEISTPEKEEKNEENEENYRIYSLMKSFKHFEIVPKQQLIKKESFLSSFSNNEKSILSFPDELTNSAQKNLLFFKQPQHTPKLLSNIYRNQRKYIKKNNHFEAKISENKAEKLLRCGEILEDLETTSNNFKSKQNNMSFKNKALPEETEDTGINCAVYRFLILRESTYQVNPYLLKSQAEINGTMRAVLLDWMSEVSSEFCFKRHTLHQAIYYLDKYLEINKNVKKKSLQLVGVASLFISAKLEEVETPKMVGFRKACDDGYSLKDIENMELDIMNCLKWLLNPPTLQNWTDIFLTQWDLYMEGCDSSESLGFVDGERMYFRKSDEQSYVHYRDFTQIIDVTMLHSDSLQYKPRALVASLLFLLIGEYYKIFTKKEIIHEFSASSKFLFNFPQYSFFLSEFLENYLGFTLYEMLPTIQYLTQFFEIEFLYELPAAEHLFEGNNLFEGYYEEFLSCHIHHQKALEFIKKKLHK